MNNFDTIYNQFSNLSQTEPYFFSVFIVPVLIFTVYLIHRKRKRIRTKIEESDKKKAEQLTRLDTTAVSQPVGEPSPVKIGKGLTKTKTFFQNAFDQLFQNSQAENFFENLEEVFLTADVGIHYSEKIVGDLKKNLGLRLPAKQELKASLTQILLSEIRSHDFTASEKTSKKPFVIMVVGVNGAGKTTTIAKLCQKLKTSGLQVFVGAADTFRAAAVEQLKTWMDRIGIEGHFPPEGASASGVAFDTVQAAVQKNADICLIDTAGRLHNKANLMEELTKMKRVIGKALPEAPHETWLVVDGSTGQNALIQAKEFHAHLGLTGIIVTKLDGSAKGGALLSISSELKLPVVYVGVGEKTEDLIPFNPNDYVETILDGLT